MPTATEIAMKKAERFFGHAASEQELMEAVAVASQGPPTSVTAEHLRNLASAYVVMHEIQAGYKANLWRFLIAAQRAGSRTVDIEAMKQLVGDPIEDVPPAQRAEAARELSADE